MSKNRVKARVARDNGKGVLPGLGEQVVPWQTPRASATAGKREPRTGRGEGWSLALTEQVVPWPTATARDHKDGTYRETEKVPVNGILGRTVVPPSGDAPMDGTARPRLNPAFALWLMGYPKQWMDAAPSAAAARSGARGTPSSRRSGQRSSKR